MDWRDDFPPDTCDGCNSRFIEVVIREPVKVGALEDNGAMVCVTNILRENKDFTWTICSANDELRMTEFYGYHYETITLLNQLKDLGRIRRL